MRTHIRFLIALTAVAAILAATHTAHANLRNVKLGQEVPGFTLPTITGDQLELASLRGKVVILAYLSAEQRSSELAAAESQQVAAKFEADKVALVHVTADAIYKPYFEKVRADKGVTCPLVFDAARTFYADLGLIAFPTTIVIDAEGRLAHLLATRGPDFSNTLEASVAFTLGQINDAEFAERLKAHPSDIRSPRSLASRHRAAARVLAEKQMYDAAKKELETARDLDPDDPDIRLDIADLCIRTGDIAAARSMIDPILESNAEHRRARLLDGIACYKEGKLDDAERILTEALVLNPDPARTYFYLGRIYEQKGDQTKALEHYREALVRLLDEPQ